MFKINLIRKSILSGVLLTSLTFQGAALANGKGDENSKEQGSSNGQPFKTISSRIEQLTRNFETAITELQSNIDSASDNLQGQIDGLLESQTAQDNLISEINVAIDAINSLLINNSNDLKALWAAHNFQQQLISTLTINLTNLEVRVAANEGDISALIKADSIMQQLISAIETNIAWLETLIENNAGDITVLQGNVDDLNVQLNEIQTALNLKQNRITGICSVGSAIRVINSDGSVVCEKNSASSDVGNLSILQKFHSFEIQPVQGVFAGTTAAWMSCPSSHRLISGGYRIIVKDVADPRLIFVQKNRPALNNTWEITVINDNPVVLDVGKAYLHFSIDCAKIVE